MSHDWRNPERVAPWKPRQQFELTAAGQSAVQRYHEVIRAAQQARDPRQELDRAKEEWARGLGLRPVDGILLEDFAAGHTRLAEMKKTLEACDMSLRDARGTLDRLTSAGLIAPQEKPGVAGPDWTSRTRP